ASTSNLNTLVYDATGANAGDFIINGDTANPINFTNTATAFDTAVAQTLTLNVDPANSIGSTVTTSFTAVGANNLETLSNSWASLNFVSPANSLVFNGHAAADTVTFTSVGTGFKPTVSVNANTTGDSVTLNAAMTLGAGANTGALSVTSPTINLGAGI